MSRLAVMGIALACLPACTTEAPTQRETQAPPAAAQPTSAYLNYRGRPDVLAGACA